MDFAWPVDATTFAAAALVVVAGYVIYGLTGFGAPMLVVPVLVQFLSLPLTVALQGLLDLFAGMLVGRRSRADIDWRLVRWMLPPMVIGMLLGFTLLVSLPQRAALLSLAACVVVYGLLGLLAKPPRRTLPRWAAVPFSLAGGALSALFSAGGPLYVIYLASQLRRPDDVRALRATIAFMALASSLLRVAIFGVGGLLSSSTVWLLAFAFAPCLWLGIRLGASLHARLDARVNRALIHALLVASGLVLFARTW
jgi:uncharacterized membrane protein YfcA